LFIRNGVAFEAEKYRKTAPIEGETDGGEASCGFNRECRIDDDPATPVCFSGNINTEETDNPTDFWFEYQHPDNRHTINENFRHYLVLSKNTSNVSNLSSLSYADEAGILNDVNRDVIIEHNLVANNLNEIMNGPRGKQINKVKIHEYGKYEDP